MSRNPYVSRPAAVDSAESSQQTTNKPTPGTVMGSAMSATQPRAFKPVLLHVGMLALALLIGAGGVMSHARRTGEEQASMQAPLLTGQIACVDMERLYAASGGPEQLAQRATEITFDVSARLKELKSVPQLDANELQEYGTLVFKSKPTDAEQTRIKDLKTLSGQRQDELNALQIKPDNMLTPADKTRMKQLQEQSRLLASILPYWQEDARAQQNERLEAFRRVQMAKLRQVVGKAAAERGIAHVFDTAALVYSANDITNMVLSRVTKHGAKDNAPKDNDSPDKN